MTVLVPGGRDVRATLDSVDGDAVVVACPPHPQHGGTRRDGRLRAVGDALGERGIDCLRFDYGPWDEGRGERADARNALRWATERYDRVGLFGYSFGGAVALVTAADSDDARPDAVSALAPISRLESGASAADAVYDVSVPMQVCYGVRDDTADWQAVVEAARAAGATVEELPADHFFVGQEAKVATTVADFLASVLQAAESR
jgi:hypothetical protein